MRPLQASGGIMPGSKPETDLRDCIRNLSRNPGADMLRYGRGKPGVLTLGQGEGDAPTPDFIIAAARRALDDGKTFYGPVLGLDETRQEISNYYARIYNLQLPTGRIYVTSSGTMAMHFALTALLDPGDEVVAVTPIWKNLLGAVELAQARFREAPLVESEGRWHFDLDRLIYKCSKKTKALLITSPSNPTGWVMSRDEIRAVIEFARSRGLWIIADEVYGRLNYDSAHAPSFLECAAPDDRLFVINSFSKAWAMTGWRLGWLVGPAGTEESIRDVALYNNLCPPAFPQYAAIEALRHGEEFLSGQLALWHGNRDYVASRLSSIDGISWSLPDSGFYAFFKTQGRPDCLSFARELIDQAKLSLAPGCAFGKVGQGYMRLCFAVSRPRLEEAMNRLAGHMAGLREKGV